MNALMDTGDLAEYLRVSKATITTRLSRDPQSLPKALDIPGMKGPRWRTEDVEAWLDRVTNQPRLGRPRTQASGPPSY